MRINFKEFNTQLAVFIVFGIISGGTLMIRSWVSGVNGQLNDLNDQVSSIKTEVDFMARSPVWDRGEATSADVSFNIIK